MRAVKVTSREPVGPLGHLILTPGRMPLINWMPASSKGELQLSKHMLR
jgi:hypothetical protein